VALEIDTRAPSGWTVADGSQLEQVVLNLAMNARDAMPDGGALTIEVHDVRVPPRAPPSDAPAGDYVAIRVRDSGCGMSAPVRQRIFEPFFTTKEPGRGTGLGLSMVYGIVKQSGGALEVESVEGAGTTVTVLLRRASAQGAAAGARGSVPDGVAGRPAGGAEAARGTVLVVEDEDEVRGVVRQILERGGYQVLEARHGVEGEAAAAGHPGPIDLLLTDVVMPELSGRELASRVRARRPETRVLYMSGYAPDRARGDGRASAGPLDAPCLQKPFTVSALVDAVRDRLGAPSR
jgi:CheY-like chemotaxis protein